jgi:hypothetical protein
MVVLFLVGVLQNPAVDNDNDNEDEDEDEDDSNGLEWNKKSTFQCTYATRQPKPTGSSLSALSHPHSILAQRARFDKHRSRGSGWGGAVL